MGAEEFWKEWLIDVSRGEPYVFVPYERETDQIVFGFNLMSGRSPGELVGVIHDGGREAADKWCEENPSWHSVYGPEGKSDV